MRKRFRAGFFAAMGVALAAQSVASAEAPSLDDEAFIYDAQGRRDPFAPLVRDGKLVSSTVAGPTTSGSVGPLTLDGILWDPTGQSIVLINGTEAKIGDTVGGYVVRDIRQDAVTLEQDGDILVLQINFEAAPAPEEGAGP